MNQQTKNKTQENLKHKSFTSRFLKSLAILCKEIFLSIKNVVSKVFQIVENWLLETKHATYGLAVTRILLGIMIVGFTISNLSTATYTFGPGAAWTGQLEYPSSSFATIWPFSIVNQAAHNSVTLILVMILMIIFGLLFMIGYRTKLMMIPLFILWVGFMSINPYVQDQSDNLTRISFIALFFTGLGDVWSVDAKRKQKNQNSSTNKMVRIWRGQRVLPSWISNSANNFAVAVIIAQLSFVYASGGLFKAGGAPWQNGTAVYDPIMTQRFGTWPILSDIATWWGPGVAIATIGTVLVQTSFPFMMLNRFTRVFALVVILFFHLGIAVLMGLPWFSLSMVALDAVFIRNRTWKKLGDMIKSFIARIKLSTA